MSNGQQVEQGKVLTQEHFNDLFLANEQLGTTIHELIEEGFTVSQIMEFVSDLADRQAATITAVLEFEQSISEEIKQKRAELENQNVEEEEIGKFFDRIFSSLDFDYGGLDEIEYFTFMAKLVASIESRIEELKNEGFNEKQLKEFLSETISKLQLRSHRQEKQEE